MKVSLPEQVIAVIHKHKPDFSAQLGLILGSGCADIANAIADKTVIAYQDLPGFNVCSVEGHPGQLVLGKLKGVNVVCLQGRAHYYEGVDSAVFKTLIRTIKLLGAETLLITNASGSLNPVVKPAELMLITDHLNFSGHNPLVGPNDEAFGPRFFSMENTYDKDLRALMKTCAKHLDISLAEGVYIGVLGPSFETPAEIRAFRMLGADAIGMSTVPEVLVARHCGLKVALVTVISNLAAGMHITNLSHEETLKGAGLGFKKLQKLVLEFVGNLFEAANS